MSERMTTPLPPGAPGRARVQDKLLLVARDIKLSHSVFALPFALLATFLAAGHVGRLPAAGELGLIVLCMVLARTVAMTVNRWADAALDADNPRTAGRAIPSGRLEGPFVLSVAIGCGFLFLATTSLFWAFYANPWPLLWSPLVLAWVAGYSFTKRFTWLCHLVLGSALAIAPVAAALAIEPVYLQQPEPWLLAAMVLCWVAGFDIIYALADMAIDREANLRSIPAVLGAEGALWVSRLLHLLALGAITALGWISPLLGAGFMVGVVAMAALLVLEHVLVAGARQHHLNLAFFTVNGVISLLLGALGILDVLRLVR